MHAGVASLKRVAAHPPRHKYGGKKQQPDNQNPYKMFNVLTQCLEVCSEINRKGIGTSAGEIKKKKN